MITFLSDDWMYVKNHAEAKLKDYRALMEQPDRTYKEKLLANGKILALRELLDLPNQYHSPINKRIA